MCVLFAYFPVTLILLDVYKYNKLEESNDALKKVSYTVYCIPYACMYAE